MKKSFAHITGLLAIFSALVIINTAHAKPTLKDYSTLPEIQSIAISPNSDLVAFRKVTSEYDRLSIVSISSHKQIANIDVKEIQPQSIYFLNEERKRSSNPTLDASGIVNFLQHFQPLQTVIC